MIRRTDPMIVQTDNNLASPKLLTLDRMSKLFSSRLIAIFREKSCAVWKSFRNFAAVKR